LGGGIEVRSLVGGSEEAASLTCQEPMDAKYRTRAFSTGLGYSAFKKK